MESPFLLFEPTDKPTTSNILVGVDFTVIYVPEPEDEAINYLSRTRETAMKDLKDAKSQLKDLHLEITLTKEVLPIGRFVVANEYRPLA